MSSELHSYKKVFTGIFIMLLHFSYIESRAQYNSVNGPTEGRELTRFNAGLVDLTRPIIYLPESIPIHEDNGEPPLPTRRLPLRPLLRRPSPNGSSQPRPLSNHSLPQRSVSNRPLQNGPLPTGVIPNRFIPNAALSRRPLARRPLPSQSLPIYRFGDY
ncbi:uncharacterized protein LOC142230491 [Haematobia irritans]|uniref:uncharacterized protein LOC142230491 n=1 Tax=Haematobia irritans TaxID=7368 RepID=UPI003F4F9CEE